MSGSRGTPVYYLVAPSGFPNFGDELILDGWLRFLADTAPGAEVVVDTHSPGPTQALLGDAHPRLKFTDTLWRLCWQAPSDDPWEVASWVRHAVGNPGMAPRWLHGIMALREVDVVHVVGGGYVNAIWPRHVGLLAGAVATARHSGAKAAMTGLGLIPASEHSRPLLRALADHFDVVDVRDGESAELLGVAPGVDDAFLALRHPRCVEPRHVWPDEPLPSVMVCLQSDMNDAAAAQVAGAALSILRAWRVPSEQVCVVEGIPGIDREIFTLIEHELPSARFYSFAEIWNSGLPVSSEQTWISTRFHLHLAAAAAGATGVAVVLSDDYYATKHRSLAKLGSGWTLMNDMTAVPPRPRGGGFSLDAVERLRQRKLALATSIYQACPATTRRTRTA